MMETLATLTWPGAVAVLGSVVAIVTGLLALAMSYLKARAAVNNGAAGNNAMKSQLPTMEIAQLHKRISEVKERVGTLEGEQKVTAVRIENLLRQLEEHAMKDTNDFQVISHKVDKLMEIIVEMLKDDR